MRVDNGLLHVYAYLCYFGYTVYELSNDMKGFGLQLKCVTPVTNCIIIIVIHMVCFDLSVFIFIFNIFTFTQKMLNALSSNIEITCCAF